MINRDSFWVMGAQGACASTLLEEIPRFITPEATLEPNVMVNAASVLRFRNERKELPLPLTQFNILKPQLLKAWCSW